MKNFIHYLLFLLLFASCIENKKNSDLDNIKYSHYDIQLTIDPDEQFIKVTGSLKYLVDEDSISVFSLNLHEQFKIYELCINGDNSYELDTVSAKVRWLPNAMKIIHRPKNKFHEGDILNVTFSYEGKITQWPSWSANVISSEWVEMGLYFPWYPNFYGPFTYRVSVDIEPGYKVFAMGKYSEENNKRIFETNFPMDDFVICASRDLKIRKTELLNQPFQIVNSTLSESIIDTIQNDIENFYDRYTKWFGEVEVHEMCLVVSKRDKGGGYARKRGLFLGGISDTAYLNNRADFIRYLGHEIAHFWWHGAESNWEDWLNESFAEYSALNLVRDLVSQEEYNSQLNKKRDDSKNTPPIWEMERNSPYAERLLYSKGVVLLKELEEKIGSNRFLELCNSCISKNINNTEDFLNLLRDREGNSTGEWFEQTLKTK